MTQGKVNVLHEPSVSQDIHEISLSTVIQHRYLHKGILGKIF